MSRMRFDAAFEKKHSSAGDVKFADKGGVKTPSGKTALPKSKSKPEKLSKKEKALQQHQRNVKFLAAVKDWPEGTKAEREYKKNIINAMVNVVIPENLAKAGINPKPIKLSQKSSVAPKEMEPEKGEARIPKPSDDFFASKPFDESKHPRGQPENAGRFAKNPGGKHAQTYPKGDKPVQAGTYIAGGKRPKNKNFVSKRNKAGRAEIKETVAALKEEQAGVTSLRGKWKIQQKIIAENSKTVEWTAKNDPPGTTYNTEKYGFLVKMDDDNPPEDFLKAYFDPKTRRIGGLTHLFTNIYLPENPDSDLRWAARSLGADDRVSYKPKDAKVQENKDETWDRNKEYSRSPTKYRQLRDKYHVGGMKDPVKALIGVMLSTGLRVGSGKNKSGTIGIREIKKKHLTKTKDSIVIEFIGKKGVTNRREILNTKDRSIDHLQSKTAVQFDLIQKNPRAKFTSDQQTARDKAWEDLLDVAQGDIVADPIVYAYLSKRMDQLKGPESTVFDVDYNKEVVPTIGKDDLEAHDCRRIVATQFAATAIQVYVANFGFPTSVLEFLTMMKGVDWPNPKKASKKTKAANLLKLVRDEPGIINMGRRWLGNGAKPFAESYMDPDHPIIKLCKKKAGVTWLGILPNTDDLDDLKARGIKVRW